MNCIYIHTQKCNSTTDQMSTYPICQNAVMLLRTYWNDLRKPLKLNGRELQIFIIKPEHVPPGIWGHLVVVVCSSLYIDGNNPGCYAWLRWQYQQSAGAIFPVIQELSMSSSTQKVSSALLPPFPFPLPFPLSILLKRAKLKGQDHQGSQILIGEDWREREIAEKRTQDSAVSLCHL